MRQGCLAILLVLSAAFAAFANDQQKAEKQIHMITAMSRDNTARSIISHTFSDVFKIDRQQLIAERKSLGLNYGALFVAHEMVLSGSNIEEIASQLRMHKTMLEIANASRSDWKRIASDAKKMNSRITDSIYKHFMHPEPDIVRDKLDRYNPAADLVRADVDSTPEEILKAQTEYTFWRNLAAPKSDGSVNPSTPATRSYQQARDDIAVSHGNTSPGSPPH
jgi:hypothetical protein